MLLQVTKEYPRNKFANTIRIIHSDKQEQDDEGIPSAYRLVISQSQDIVYAFCPTNFEPELNYLRNVKAIQCTRSRQ
uniref:Uncharacterized protein n=1 Tax=Oscillatoriales cyanobacterium SpSt-402 TaxID=2282168 RepID=A0A832H6L1_9CYAN